MKKLKNLLAIEPEAVHAFFISLTRLRVREELGSLSSIYRETMI
jgi:hypothetical protein